jgi:ribosomal protein S8
MIEITNLISKIQTRKEIKIEKITQDILQILHILNKEGYLSIKKLNSCFLIKLSADISVIRMLSLAGRRKYISTQEIRSYQRGLGVYIIRTPQGIMSMNDAIKRNIGGELLLQIY